MFQYAHRVALRLTFMGLLAMIPMGMAMAADLSRVTDLLSVYEQARQNDPEFLAAGAGRLAAAEARPQALARLRPNINFTTSLTRTRSELLSVPPGRGGDLTRTFRPANLSYFNTTAFSLTIGQPLYHHDYWVQLRQAGKQVAQAEAEYAAASQALITRTAERYFNVLAADDGVHFAVAEADAIQRQLDQARQRFDAGLVAITDVHEARAARDLARARSIVAKNQLISARESLRELTGRPVGAIAGLDEQMQLQSPEPADVNQWGQAALAQNLQIRASQIGLEVADDEVRVRRSGHYPTLDLNLNHAYQDTKNPNFTNENQDSSIAVQLNVPIYQGGATHSRVREAVQLREQARQGLEQQRRASLRQARDAYLTVRANMEQVEALRQARISAQSALDATRSGFEAGTRTTVDVLNARQAVFRAKRDLARARYDYLLNSLRLREAVGTLSIKDILAMNRWFTVPELLQ